LSINNLYAFKLNKESYKKEVSKEMKGVNNASQSENILDDASSSQTNKRNSSERKRSKNTLRASEIREESKESLKNCANVYVKEEYADCVIDNLSLEFFFTAFIYYKKRFKKSYGSVREENRRFQIFMKNYQLILK
jgi:hypothetical protein